MSLLRRLLLRLLTKLQPHPKLHNFVIDIYCRYYPLPFLDNAMEFRYGVWAGISTIRCKEGRQLGETNSTPLAFRRAAPTQFHSAHLEGSRAGYSINLTALQNIMRYWPDLMAFIQALRPHLLKKLGIRSEPLSAGDLYLLALTFVAIPAYLARRSKAPIGDGHITVLIADQQKLITGVFMIIRHMIEQNYPGISTSSFINEDALYDYADQHNLFLSPEGKPTACGGSKRKILELLRQLIYLPNEPAPAISAEVEQNLAAIGELDDFLIYAISACRLELSLMLTQLTLKQFQDQAQGDSKATGILILENILQQLDEKNYPEELARIVALKAGTEQAIYDIALACHNFVQSNQRRINRLLGYQQDAIITFEDVCNKLNLNAKSFGTLR